MSAQQGFSSGVSQMESLDFIIYLQIQDKAISEPCSHSFSLYYNWGGCGNGWSSISNTCNYQKKCLINGRKTIASVLRNNHVRNHGQVRSITEWITQGCRTQLKTTFTSVLKVDLAKKWGGAAGIHEGLMRE